MVPRRPRGQTAGPQCLQYSAYLSRLQRADERTRTAVLISLQVNYHSLQGCARGCKSRISKGFSYLCLAWRGTVLRSRWCQSGVNITLVSTFDRAPGNRFHERPRKAVNSPSALGNGPRKGANLPGRRGKTRLAEVTRLPVPDGVPTSVASYPEVNQCSTPRATDEGTVWGPSNSRYLTW